MKLNILRWTFEVIVLLVGCWEIYYNVSTLAKDMRMTLAALLVCIAAVLVFALHKIAETNKKTATLLKTYHNLAHKLRDSFQEIKTKASKTPEAKTEITDKIKATMKEQCTLIEKCINHYLGKNVNVCIKLMYNNSTKRPEDWELFTFCRSMESSPERAENDKTGDEVKRIVVKKNTDFMEIVCNGKSYFVMNDLRKAYDAGNYKNCSERFWLHYNSTIVLPIRIKNDQTPADNTVQYIIIGFLCIDSFDKNAFRLGTGDIIINILKPVVDNYYSHLSSVTEYINT